MHMATRFVLAWDVSPNKEKYDAAPLLRAAKDGAGRAPRLFVTDGLKQCHMAFKKACRTVRGLKCWHIRDIHIRNTVCNTNKQERLNREFADRFWSARGINGKIRTYSAWPCPATTSSSRTGDRAARRPPRPPAWKYAGPTSG